MFPFLIPRGQITIPYSRKRLIARERFLYKNYSKLSQQQLSYMNMALILCKGRKIVKTMPQPLTTAFRAQYLQKKTIFIVN